MFKYLVVENVVVAAWFDETFFEFDDTRVFMFVVYVSKDEGRFVVL